MNPSIRSGKCGAAKMEKLNVHQARRSTSQYSENRGSRRHISLITNVSEDVGPVGYYTPKEDHSTMTSYSEVVPELRRTRLDGGFVPELSM